MPAGAKGVAHTRDIAGHGAVAERDKGTRPLADLADLAQVVLGADGALDQGYVHTFWELLGVDETAVNELNPAGQI